MKLGDLVVKAYSHSPVVTGIIVEEVLEDCIVDVDDEEEQPYVLTSFQVLWPDGSETNELYEELDYAADLVDVWDKLLN